MAQRRSREPRNEKGRQLARQTVRQPSGHRPADGQTTTKNGLTVRCELDLYTYPAGIKVSDADMAAVNLTAHNFHGDWNYTVTPKALTVER